MHHRPVGEQDRRIGPEVADETRPSPAGPNGDKEVRRLDTLSAFVLAIAAVATAWSAYQATRWGGVSIEDFNEANSLRTDSDRLTTQAGLQNVIDVTVAADWAMAASTRNETLAAELRSRMSPELSAAMDAWLKGWRFGEPLPPGDAFSAGEYRTSQADQADALQRQADAKFADGRRANQHSDNYVLNGVLFALTLFFAGVATRFETRRHRRALVISATCVVVLGVVLLLIQPKSIGI